MKFTTATENSCTMAKEMKAKKHVRVLHGSIPKIISTSAMPSGRFENTKSRGDQ